MERAAFPRIPSGREEGSYAPRQPNIKIPRKVIKGGLHLCAPELLPPLSPGRAPC